MSDKNMNLTLKIWRQNGPTAQGALKTYELKGVSEHQSFLEMIDQLNDELVRKGEEQVAFESDCREGICGARGCMVNGQAHGPDKGVTLCQLHMRTFSDGDTIVIEPFRAKAFPVIRDLVVDRRALDRIMMATAPPYSGQLIAGNGHGKEKQSKLAWTIVEDDFEKGIATALEEKKLALINWTGKL